MFDTKFTIFHPFSFFFMQKCLLFSIQTKIIYYNLGEYQPLQWVGASNTWKMIEMIIIDWK